MGRGENLNERRSKEELNIGKGRRKNKKVVENYYSGETKKREHGTDCMKSF